jgi:hypothetical protein
LHCISVTKKAVPRSSVDRRQKSRFFIFVRLVILTAPQ